MGSYLIDNNVISNYFSGMFSEKAMNFVADIIDQTPNISVITQIEALSWRNPDESKEAIVRTFIEDANILGLSLDVVSQCIRIRRNQKIKTPDAIIAATAITLSLTLITSDKDFAKIPGLKFVDPHTL